MCRIVDYSECVGKWTIVSVCALCVGYYYEVQCTIYRCGYILSSM